MPSVTKKSVVGIYQHYKGKFYEVLGIARHSENLEEFVVYKALYLTRYGRNSIWIRPKKMFFEKIQVEGKNQLRFKRSTDRKKGNERLDCLSLLGIGMI